MGLMMLASVGIFVATIHYCLMIFELGVVRDDIRRLAEQIAASGGPNGLWTPLGAQPLAPKLLEQARSPNGLRPRADRGQRWQPAAWRSSTN